VQLALVEDLRSQVGEEWPAPTAEAVKVRAESSMAVPGLTYFWGVYEPPNSTHASWVSVVGSREKDMAVLHGIEDWTRLTHQWPAIDEGAAYQACVELITIFSDRGDPSTPVIPYLDTVSLAALPIPDPDALTSRLNNPKIEHRDSGDWLVRGWFIEIGRAAEYECKLRDNEDVKLSIVDSIPDVGFLPRGP
jgi:hypothetical protein